VLEGGAMIPVSYELKRAIANVGVQWKPEIRRGLPAAPVYVTAIKENEELWGQMKEGVILPHEVMLIECGFPSISIWSHYTVYVMQSAAGLLMYPFLRERDSCRWTTTEVECAYDRATGTCQWIPNPAVMRSKGEIRLLVESVLAIVFSVADALERGDAAERATSVSLTRRRQFAGPGVSGWVYRTLDIDPQRIKAAIRQTTGTHASPRWHIRRGHWRTLAGGRKTFVRECEVGDPARGGVIKDYRVQMEATI
jgi:hypothetical protein